MFARFLIDAPPERGTRIALSGDELHHAARVLRVRAGERVEVFDGKGAGAVAVVVAVSDGKVEIEVGQSVSSRESPVEIVLAAALIAPDKYELVLQKACELGVSRFVPVVSSRVETRVERIKGKFDRWQRIILESTKQCGRLVLPRLDAPIAYSDVVDKETNLVVFDADANSGPWPDATVESLTLVVGPEGGLTPEEIEMARGAGALVCSLGPRRLRAETASMAAVAIAGSRFGDL